VLEGLAEGDAVAEPVRLTEPLDTGSPAIAVTSSARVEEEEYEILVAFRAPVIVVADALCDEEARIVAIELLGWVGAAAAEEESCAVEHCEKKT